MSYDAAFEDGTVNTGTVIGSATGMIPLSHLVHWVRTNPAALAVQELLAMAPRFRSVLPRDIRRPSGIDFILTTLDLAGHPVPCDVALLNLPRSLPTPFS